MQELLLRQYHEVSGAVFRPEAGWSVPAGYGRLDAEVRAVRSHAGMMDVSDRAKIELTGSERVPFLDGLVTPDIKVLTPGTSAYALMLNEKSRVLGDLRVYAFPDSLVLDIEAAQKESILGLLNKARVSDDVEFRDLGSTGHIAVHGPAAGSVIDNTFGWDVRSLPLDAFRTFSVDRHHTGHVARIRGTGEVGYAIWSPGASLADAWDALSRRGAAPIGRDAYEVLRIEAGTPRFGAEMGEDTLALEVAPESALSFTKGCYTGQEVVARGTYVGQIRRKVLGLRIDVDVPPVHGNRVSNGGREVGSVTSAAWSPTLGWVIALALLRVDAVSPVDPLFIDGGGWDLRARLHSLPFVRTAA
jgi:folate-binding protein YgfZ